MHPGVYVMKENRERMLPFMRSLDDQRLWTIPEGFKNHIAWNLGHIVVTQQLLHYNNTGLDMHIDESTLAAFRKGTSPADWSTRPDMEKIRDWLIELPDIFDRDLEVGKFGAYQRYTTLSGVVLSSLEDAIAFNNFHEGIHLGVMLSMWKLV